MIELKQTEIFAKWESRLRDKRARTVIATRLARLAYGLPGDVSPVGEGVSELRVHYGPGYRIYFQQHGAVLIVLLCGGDKKTQSRDIAKAKRLVCGGDKKTPSRDIIAMAKRLAKEWSAQNG